MVSNNTYKLPFFTPGLLRLDMQFFSEDPPAVPPVPPIDPPTPPTDPPKTYSETYVKELREEAAGYRVKVKQLEGNASNQQQELINKVFAALGISPDPNVEFEKQLSTATQTAQEAKKWATDKLIQAELKSVGTSLNLIDLEAAEKLVDKSTFVVKEDGTVEGVKEALEKLALEKPYLVSAPGEPKFKAYNPGPGQKGNNPQPEDAYAKAKANFDRLKKANKIKL